MAVVKASKGGRSLSGAIKYAAKDKLLTGINCPDDKNEACKQMEITKQFWEKEGGRQYKSYIISFAKGEIDSKKANDVGREFAEKNFPGHESVIGTHINSKSGIIHVHIIVNSVNFEDGTKLHTNNQDLERFKSISDHICREHGLSVIDREKARERGTVVAWDRNKYQVLCKALEGRGKSFLVDIGKIVEKSLAETESKGMKAFQEDLRKHGIEMKYQGDKHLTFSDNEGNKVRGATLAKTFTNDWFTRENIITIVEHGRVQKHNPALIEIPQMQLITDIKRIVDSRGLAAAALGNSIQKTLKGNPKALSHGIDGDKQQQPPRTPNKGRRPATDGGGMSIGGSNRRGDARQKNNHIESALPIGGGLSMSREKSESEQIQDLIEKGLSEELATQIVTSQDN